MTAAPSHFPYHHRTLSGHFDGQMLERYERCARRFNAGKKDWREVDKRTTRAAEQSTVDAVHSFVADATLFGVCATRADREDACNARLGPDRNAFRGGPG